MLRLYPCLVKHFLPFRVILHPFRPFIRSLALPICRDNVGRYVYIPEQAHGHDLTSSDGFHSILLYCLPKIELIGRIRRVPIRETIGTRRYAFGSPSGSASLYIALISPMIHATNFDRTILGLPGGSFRSNAGMSHFSTHGRIAFSILSCAAVSDSAGRQSLQSRKCAAYSSVTCWRGLSGSRHNCDNILAPAAHGTCWQSDNARSHSTQADSGIGSFNTAVPGKRVTGLVIVLGIFAYSFSAYDEAVIAAVPQSGSFVRLAATVNLQE